MIWTNETDSLAQNKDINLRRSWFQTVQRTAFCTVKNDNVDDSLLMILMIFSCARTDCVFSSFFQGGWCFGFLFLLALRPRRYKFFRLKRRDLSEFFASSFFNSTNLFATNTQEEEGDELNSNIIIIQSKIVELKQINTKKLTQTIEKGENRNFLNLSHIFLTHTLFWCGNSKFYFWFYKKILQVVSTWKFKNREKKTIVIKKRSIFVKFLNNFYTCNIVQIFILTVSSSFCLPRKKREKLANLSKYFNIHNPTKSLSITLSSCIHMCSTSLPTITSISCQAKSEREHTTTIYTNFYCNKKKEQISRGERKSCTTKF